jgi:hypothetical protein
VAGYVNKAVEQAYSRQGGPEEIMPGTFDSRPFRFDPSNREGKNNARGDQPAIEI